MVNLYISPNSGITIYYDHLNMLVMHRSMTFVLYQEIYLSIFGLTKPWERLSKFEGNPFSRDFMVFRRLHLGKIAPRWPWNQQFNLGSGVAFPWLPARTAEADVVLSIFCEL